MIKDAIEDAESLDRTESSIDLYLDGWRCLEERKGGVMIEQKDNDELTAAYLAGCHATRKAYEQRLAAAEAKNTELEKELFVLSSDVIYFENQTLPYEIVRKAKRVYDELRRSEGEL